MDYPISSDSTTTNDQTSIHKERRFSVHNIDENEPAVHYGQPENNDIIDDQPQIIKAFSLTDDEPTDYEKHEIQNMNNSSISVSGDSIGDQAVIITNNNEVEYYDDDDQYDSLSNTLPTDLTPENSTQNEYIVDDDESTGHERYSSTIIHSPSGSNSFGRSSQLPMSSMVMAVSTESSGILPMCAQKDYWCHVSDTIALDEQGSHPLADNQLQTHDHAYTRPLICKVNENHSWSSAFGNGIVSNMHTKYASKSNGTHIEWVIEVLECAESKNSEYGSIMFGVSSDMSETNKETNFAFTENGYAFDSFGNIIHNSKSMTNGKINMNLMFNNKSSVNIVHIVLDYSCESKWKLYAIVGDVDNDRSHAEQFVLLFDDLPPRAYRLAVALFSINDALVIENCTIFGTTKGEFYQELKSYKKHSYVNEDDDDDEDVSEEDDNIAQLKLYVSAVAEDMEISDDNIEYKVVTDEQRLPRSNTVIVNNVSDNEYENEDEKAMIENPESITVGNEDILQVMESNRILQKESNERLDVIKELKLQLQEMQNKKNEIGKKEVKYIQTIEHLEKIISENEQTPSNSTPVLKTRVSDSKQLQIKCRKMKEENERLVHELQLAQERSSNFEQHQILLRVQLEDCIKSKMNLIQSTSCEINRYRRLIKEIAMNKTGIVVGAQKIRYLNNNKNGYL